MRSAPTTQPLSLLDYVRARDAWNADLPMTLAELERLTGLSRTTLERRLEGVRAANAVGQRLRPRRGARFLPSVVAPSLFDGQPHRRLGPAPDESAALVQEAS